MISGQRLRFSSSRQTEFIDLTARLQDAVSDAGLVDGRIYLSSLHSTLALAINEDEPLLLGDFATLLARLVPQGAGYQHDDFARRVGIPVDEPINGHAHGRQILLHPGLTLLVEGGRLVLGRYQSVFAVELDGPRDRTLALQLDGRFGSSFEERDRDLVELELQRQLLVDPEPVQLPMRRLIQAGGKRLRPLLVLMSARFGPRQDRLRATQLAAAIELLHNATLVHDDYVDESPRRRDRPTVVAAEGPARAIAVGDYYFAKSTRLIAELGSPAVTGTIADALEAICGAQIDDYELRGRYPGDEHAYLRVVRGKTAALISAACVAGAQLAEAPAQVVEALRRYGELVGVAFQMTDDLVDFSERSGKPLGQDIRERVLSLPMIYATEDPAVGPQLRSLLASPLDDEGLREVVGLVRSSGALRRVVTEARRMAEEAVGELERTQLDGATAPLSDLALTAVDRTG